MEKTQLSQAGVLQEGMYMPLGVRIRQEWLNRKKAELSIISGKVDDALGQIQSSDDTAHCLVRMKQKTVKFETKDKSDQTEEANASNVLNIPTERDNPNFDNTDFLQCMNYPLFLTNKNIGKFPQKSHNILDEEKSKYVSMAVGAESKSQKSRHILQHKSKELSPNIRDLDFGKSIGKMKSRSQINDNFSLQRTESNQKKRSVSRPKRTEKKHSVSKINSFQKLLGTMISLPQKKRNLRKKRVQNKTVNRRYNENSSATRTTSKIKRSASFGGVKIMSTKNQKKTSNKARQSRERHTKRKRQDKLKLKTRNDSHIPADIEMIRYSVSTKNATKNVANVNNLEQKSTQKRHISKPQTSFKTTLPASKTASRKRSETSQIVHKNTQTYFDDDSNLQCDSKEFFTAIEVARIEEILKTANKRHRKAPLSRKQNIGSPMKQHHEMQSSSSAPNETSDISEITQDISSLDMMQDDLDGEPCLTSSLLKKLQRTLSLAKGKMDLNISGIGFRNHQLYPINSVFCHNSLPKTPQQLGIPCIKKPLRSKSAGDLESLQSDVVRLKPKGKRKKRRRIRNSRKC